MVGARLRSVLASSTQQIFLPSGKGKAWKTTDEEMLTHLGANSAFLLALLVFSHPQKWDAFG